MRALCGEIGIILSVAFRPIFDHTLIGCLVFTRHLFCAIDVLWVSAPQYCSSILIRHQRSRKYVVILIFQIGIDGDAPLVIARHYFYNSRDLIFILNK